MLEAKHPCDDIVVVTMWFRRTSPLASAVDNKLNVPSDDQRDDVGLMRACSTDRDRPFIGLRPGSSPSFQ